MKNLKILPVIAGVLSYLIVAPVVSYAATLSFEPATGVINKGCEISIKVNLDTQGVQTDGTDMVVLYSPAQLTTSTSNITNGTIYPEYPGNSVDAAGGKIGVTGISSISSPFSGAGAFTTIKFTVASTLANNTAVNLNFDFDPNNKTKTTDSNVIEKGTIADVLSSVTNGTYTVGSGSCAAGVGATSGSGTGTSGTAGGAGGQGQVLPGTSPSSTQSAQYQVYKPNLNDVTGNGKSAGLLDNTIALAAVGSVLVILGIVGLAML